MAIRSAKFDDETHTYVDPDTGLRVASVTQIRNHFGLGLNYDAVDGETMQYARDLGNEVDRSITLIEQGFELQEVDSRVQACIDGYLELKTKVSWKPTLIHNGDMGPAISEINGMPIAFCTDMVGMLNGEEAVVELKRTSTVGAGAGFQLAGYDLALGGPRRRRVVFQILPGKFKVYDDQERNSKVFSSQDHAIFQSALALYWYKFNRGLLNGR